MADAADDELAAIAHLIAGGDDQAGYAQLAARIGWPRGKDLAELSPWIGVLATLAERRGAPQLAQLAREVVRDPDSPDRLYELGYALIDANASAIAASVLWRCMQLVGDSEQVVCELVSALETHLAHADAFELLESREALRAESFMCRYLHAFDAAMTGRLDVTRAVLPTLAGDDTDDDHLVMIGAIRAIVERADRVAGACQLDAGDLRGWHYVITGGLLAHQSPYGWPAPMRGRYAWLHDSIARVATGLDRLGPLAAAAGAPCVYAPPGRDHEIVAQAAARRLGLPLMPWPTIGVPAPGIVALYDLAALPGDLAKLVARRDGQILYAHAAPWTRDCAIAPDVTTLLYQHLVPPWDDVRPIEAIADDIAASAGSTSDDLAADEPARWDALVSRAWPPAPGQRSRAWAGGPVRSNRFE
ncbi:MAG TPA: hypothetical protein VGL61_20930 [Kofleriaceae bacterium]|jgi:hypothetical protein